MPQIVIPGFESFEVQSNPHHANTGDKRLTVQVSDTDGISDGYHTFGELYQHRCLLFCALIKESTNRSWKSRLHEDGSSFDGWFIAGFDIGIEESDAPLWITYHLPNSMWELCQTSEIEFAHRWDGHTSFDVLNRLTEFVNG